MSSLSLAAETKEWMGGDAECGQRRGSFGDGSHARSLTATRRLRLRPHSGAFLCNDDGQAAQAPRAEAPQEGRLSQRMYAFSLCFFCHIPHLLAVEARCKSSRDQGYAPVPHPGQRRLPQVKHASPFFSYRISNHASNRYNKLCGSLRSLAHRLSLLPAQDPFRARMEGQVLSKLFDMGVLNAQAKLSDVDNKLTVAAFCRRRLAVIMVVAKMAETVSAVCNLPVLVPQGWEDCLGMVSSEFQTFEQ